MGNFIFYIENLDILYMYVSVIDGAYRKYKGLLDSLPKDTEYNKNYI